MKLTHRTAGLGIAAVAVLLLGSVAIADNLGKMRRGHGMDGHGMDGHGMMMGGMMMGGMMMGGMMMGGPVANLAALDADKDGKISKDELTAYHTARVAALDGNGDGKLSADELAAMHLQAMTAAAKTMADRMIDRLDSDGDKALSAAEMADRPVPTDLFARLDSNADGFIDQAEIDAAKAGMLGGEGRRGGHHRGHMGGHMGGHGGGHGGGMMDDQDD